MQSLLKRNWSSRWVSCSYYKECSSRYNKRLKELYWPKKSVDILLLSFWKETDYSFNDAKT